MPFYAASTFFLLILREKRFERWWRENDDALCLDPDHLFPTAAGAGK